MTRTITTNRKTRHPRRLKAAALTSSAAFLLAACGGGAEGENGDGPIQLTLAVETSEGDPLHDMLATFAEEVEDSMADEVEIQLLTGGATGNEEAVLQGVREGEMDVAAVSGSVATLDPTFNIMEVPFLFSDRETVSDFLDGDFGTEMSESLEEEIGVSVIAFGENGFRQITSNQGPIETPDDLAGQQLRTPGSPERVNLFESLGASPQQVDIDETYLALEQGVLDGQENPLSVIDAFSFYEQQDYLSLTSHIYSPVYLVVNEENWGELPDDVRSGLESAAVVASETSRSMGEQADAELLEYFESEGVQITEPDLDAFVEAVTEVRDGIAADIPGDFGTRVLEEYDS